MITKEAIEAAAVAISGAPFPTKRSLAKAEAALTAAFAAMPGPAVKVNPLELAVTKHPSFELPDDLMERAVDAYHAAAGSTADWDGVAAALKTIIRQLQKPAPAPDLSSENERLRAALEKIADTDPNDGTSWFHEVANAALERT